MRIGVCVFNGVNVSARGDPGQLSQKGLSIPRGYTLTGGQRKFIVLKDDDQAVLVIGPQLAEEAYLHKDLLNLAHEVEELSGLAVSGGGFVDFSLSQESKAEEAVWTAKFSGKTLDFGVYDPAILSTEARSALQSLLEVRVSFNWQW